jgi:hypothetical protein
VSEKRNLDMGLEKPKAGHLEGVPTDEGRIVV